MKFIHGELYHISNRGNNGQPLFFNGENYLFLLKKVKVEILPYSDVLAYCLMPNHYRLLVKTKDERESDEFSQLFSRKLDTLQSSYTRAINKYFNKHGSLFQQKLKAKHISEYGPICFHYIYQNPLRADLCHRLEDWEFSSFRDYMGMRDGKLPNTEMAFRILDIPVDKKLLLNGSMGFLEESLIEGIH